MLNSYYLLQYMLYLLIYDQSVRDEVSIYLLHGEKVLRRSSYTLVSTLM